MMLKLYQMDMQNASLNRYLSEEVEELYFSSMMGFNEGVAKDVDVGKMYLLNEDTMLKYFCHPKEAFISKEDGQFLEEVL